MWVGLPLFGHILPFISNQNLDRAQKKQGKKGGDARMGGASTDRHFSYLSDDEEMHESGLHVLRKTNKKRRKSKSLAFSEMATPPHQQGKEASR